MRTFLASITLLMFSRCIHAFTRPMIAAGKSSALTPVRATSIGRNVYRASLLNRRLAQAALSKLFSTTTEGESPAAAAPPAAATEQSIIVEWIGDCIVKLAWKDSISRSSPTKSSSFKVIYRQKADGGKEESSILNQLTVGRTEATLRDLLPASKYTLGIYKVTEGGTQGTLIAQSVINTPKAPEKPKVEVTELSRLEIRVGRIVEIGRHPDADTLYVEKVDMGEGEPRTIVSGLVKYQTEEDLSNRDVIVLANLKPRAMRGVTSHGMLLCASNEEHSVVVPLSPPAGTPIGELITFEGHASQPEPPGNRASKAFDRVAEEFFSNHEKIATFKGTPFMTSLGPVTAALKGSIS